MSNTSKSNILSIVIPCYNSQSTIMRLVSSMRRQIAPSEWDVTFVDDHSYDHTVDSILSQMKPNPLQQSDPRFRILINPAKGAGSARNYGMQQTVGEYLWFIDSDDYIPNGYAFSILLNAIHKNPDVDLFTMNCIAVDDAGKKVNKSFTNLRADSNLYGKVLSRKDFIQNFESLYSAIGFPPWNKVVRRKFLEKNKINFQNTLFCNDQYFSIRCMVEAQKIYMISSDPLYCWSNAGRFHTSRADLKKSHPEQYGIVLEGLDKKCKWPNDEIRKKILEDRSKQFKCDILKKSGRL